MRLMVPTGYVAGRCWATRPSGQIADCGFRIADFGLRIADWRMADVGCGIGELGRHREKDSEFTLCFMLYALRYPPDSYLLII